MLFDTVEGGHALASAEELSSDDPLAAASAMRARGFDADLASAALTQVALRRRATGKFGADAARMFFTRAGLEQATRGVVAARRAARLAAAGATSVADLGCGIGADALAFARAGLRVVAAEIDPLAAAIARMNVAAFGLGSQISVLERDATALSLEHVDAVFCDPARRTDRGRRVFDPARYSPPWDFVAGLPASVPLTVLKLAPGIDHALLPEGCETEWVSVNGEVVEAACWCGPLARVGHRATLLRPAAPGADSAGVLSAELTGSGTTVGEVAPARRFLYDPDGAVVRSHLVAEFASTVGGTLADPTIAYVYADAPTPTPFGRCYEVVERLPVAVKRLRSALRQRGVGVLTILKRGSALDVQRLRRDLRLTGDHSAVLVLTRIAGDPAALLCQRP
ncbi:MAG: methyltransferase domain-containing protein [Dactylosporangium sp.]|nr:methyltransferase domain-containing protein [Dactylosporangium sp.]NNJ59873.1 methyltransferase domain-containing protein [Dactylosporangium sp.]